MQPGHISLTVNSLIIHVIHVTRYLYAVSRTLFMTLYQFICRGMQSRLDDSWGSIGLRDNWQLRRWRRQLKRTV